MKIGMERVEGWEEGYAPAPKFADSMSVWWRIRSFRASACASTREDVREEVRDSLREVLRGSLREILRGSLREMLRGSLRDSARELMRELIDPMSEGLALMVLPCRP